MVIQDWIYFSKVAECRSISRAADELYRTYQGVHKSIAHLENALGASLFDRSFGEMTLTPFGEYIKNYICEPLLNYWDSANSGLDGYRSHQSSLLRIGLSTDDTQTEQSIQAICHSFEKQYPNWTLEYVFQKVETNKSMVKSGALDIALSSFVHPESSLDCCLHYRSETTLYVGPSHRLASHTSVTKYDLRGEAVQVYNPDSPINIDLVRLGWVKREDFVAFDPSSPLPHELLLENKLVRIMFKDPPQYKDLVQVPLEPPMYVDMAMMYRKIPRPKPALADFIAFAAHESDKYPGTFWDE